MAARRKTTRKKSTRKRTSRASESRHPTHPLSARGQKVLERVRAICLSLPEATEKEAWGAPTFRVRDKLFCHFRENHHGDKRLAIWCKAPLGDQQILVETDPDLFFVPPYVGPKGWIGVRLEQPDWQLVEELLIEGYRMNASQRQIAQLEAEGRS